jgi:VWFA-related protein
VLPLQSLLMRTLAAIVLPALLFANPAAPAQSGSNAGPTATLKVTTRLTLVDVTVTDAKGRSVRGLTQSDFTIKEDTKPQPIKNFEEHGSETPAPVLPPNVYTNRQDPNAPAVNILLLDMVTLGITDDFRFRPAAFKDAREASLNFLKTMPEGTQVAVLVIDGSGMHAVQGFTSDRERLLAAVNSITYQRVADSKWDPPDAPLRPASPVKGPTTRCCAMR